MEMFKILFLTVAVIAPVTSQNAADDVPIPKLTADPTWTEFFPNEQITMQCGFGSSSDGWSFEWTKNGKPINTNPTLTITAKSSSDSGQYACKGKLNGRSVITQQSNVFQLNVKDVPIPKLTAYSTWTEFFPNEQITMQCGFGSSSDGWSFEWTKNGKQINTNPTLTITAKSSSDSGQYACKGKLNGRSVITQQSNVFQLNVREIPIPKLTANPTWTEFYPNEQITMQCEFGRGSKGWSVEWTKNGKQMNTNPTLTITTKSSSDSGQYACKGKLNGRSVITQQSNVFQLNVRETPIPKLTMNPAWKEFFPNEQIIMQCGFGSSSDGWSFEWTRNGELITINPTLTITAKSSSDSGQYACKGKLNGRSVTTKQSNVFQLNVKEIPIPNLAVNPTWTQFFPNEQITMQCGFGSSSDGWSFEWTKKGKTIKTNPTLTITAKRSDAGQYACKGKLNGRSVITQQSNEFQLNVRDIPIPKLTVNPTWTEFFPNEQITMQCGFGSSSDGWSFEWTKKGRIIKINPTLTITAKSSDSGQYACKGKLNGRSVFTQQSDVFQLNVKEIPIPKLTANPTWTEFFPNEQITMQCGFGSNSDGWSFEWTKKGKPIKTNPTLTITAKSSSDSGQYACKGKLNGRSVITQQSNVFQLNVRDYTPKPTIRPEPSFEFFYTGEQVQLTCDMPGAAWKYYWFKDSKTTELSTANKKYIINSSSLHDTGEYHCEAKRRHFTIQSERKKVQVKALSATSLNLVTELSDIIAGNILTLNCKVLDDKTWTYTWFENNQELNESSSTLKVISTEETIKNEFKCRGKRTKRPLQSSWSEGFKANNILFKRKILLAISGCFVCCIVILIIGCIVLKITRKPEKKEPVHEDLFISLADSKNQTTSPLMEYMDRKPLEKESEEKEELQLDRISVTHVDGVIMGEDSPSAETNDLTSFKAI
nr:hemicentin-1-like isoform X2 [Misgurnus anguillicaudatus]